MKKEWLLAAGSVVVSVVVGIGAIQMFAPQLLGQPGDLQLVQVDEKVPPFFEGVFRREDLQSREFMLKDPLTRIRAKPFYPSETGLGPHDLLGFRNRAVPNLADVVVIGDSQTYGNNAVLEQNWPHQMERQLHDKDAVVYSMAVGGWGAVQYLDMAYNATVLRPRVLVVAFYTGNDPLESFQMAYALDHWSSLQPDPGLGKGDGPDVEFPPPEAQWWKVSFDDGEHTVFTPTLRLAANQAHPAVDAGYAIMQDVARRISQLMAPFDVPTVFTVVPTKELVYKRKVIANELEMPADYLTLMQQEERRISEMRQALEGMPGAVYVDVVEPLQQAVLSQKNLYPSDKNGHPFSPGYGVIADAVSDVVSSLLPDKPDGLVAVKRAEDVFEPVLVRDRQWWKFATEEILVGNGWTERQLTAVSERDLADIPMMGVINSIDPPRFGPAD